MEFQDWFINSALNQLYSLPDINEFLWIMRSWTEQEKERVQKLLQEALKEEEIGQIMLQEIEWLTEPKKTIFENWFEKCKNSLSFFDTIFPIQYIYTIFCSNSFKNADKIIWRLKSNANLSQHFIPQAIKVFFTKQEFIDIFTKYKEILLLSIKDIDDKNNLFENLISIFTENFDKDISVISFNNSIETKYIEIFEQIRYIILRNKIFFEN